MGAVQLCFRRGGPSLTEGFLKEVGKQFVESSFIHLLPFYLWYLARKQT